MKRTPLLTAIAALLVVACGSDPAPSDPGAAGSTSDAGALGDAGEGSGTAGSVAEGGSAAGASAGEAGSNAAGGSAAGGPAIAGAGGTAGSGGGSAGSGVTDPGTDGDGDLTIGPTFTDASEIAVNAKLPHGTVYKFTLSSTVSKIFTGLDKTLLAANQKAFTREINVYIPKQYVDGKAAPILVVQDGASVDLRTDTVNALDNLIGATDVTKRIPAIVAIFIANGGGDSKGSERGLEYDTVSDRYVRFVQTEILDAVKANAAIKAAYPKLTFTDDPEGRGAYGCSSGGEASFTMGWFKPEWFRRIITYSGTFVDLQDDDARGKDLSTRLLGVSLQADPRGSRQAAARVLGRVRQGQSLHGRRGHALQLAVRQSAHGRRAQGQGLPLPLRVREGCRALRREGTPRHAARYSALDVARLPAAVTLQPPSAARFSAAMSSLFMPIMA